MVHLCTFMITTGFAEVVVLFQNFNKEMVAIVTEGTSYFPHSSLHIHPFLAMA